MSIRQRRLPKRTINLKLSGNSKSMVAATEIKWKKYLVHPIALHIYLWVAILMNEVIDLQYNDEITSKFILHKVIIYAATAFVIYTNLFWLIPKYLKRRKYIPYLFAFLLLNIVVAFFYTLIHQQLYPDCNLFLAFRNRMSSIILYCLEFMALKYFLDYLKEEQHRQELEQKHAEQRLRHLKGQINPHFLFNTINSFYALAVAKSNKLPDLLLRHADLLRYSLYETELKKVALSKEIDFLAGYVELESIRLEDNVEVQFEINGIVNGQKIAPLLMMPIFENAFKHCVDSDEEAFVHIQMDIKDQEVFLQAKNSKNEYYQPMEKGGIGLKNLQQRLNLLYPNRHNLQIEEQANVYSIQLKMEL